MLRLRLIELASFFVIVAVSREIASFNYSESLLLYLFAGAALLQITGPLLWRGVSGRWGWSPKRTEDALLSYSSIVDALGVLGIVYLTGTIESPFLFLLVVPLFFVSHLLPWRVTVGFYLTGTVTLVALLGYLELRGSVPHFNCYLFQNDVYTNLHYYVGSLLVLSGFLSLILFLSNAFQDHFIHSVSSLQERDRESKDKLEELSRLYDISLGINAVMTVETLLKMVAKEASLLLSQPWASVILFNSREEITHSAIVGIPENYRVDLGTKIRKGGLTEWLREYGEPLVIEDVLADRRAATGEFLMATNIRSLIGLPLSNGKAVIGVIYVGDFVPKHFEEKHVRLLSIMSDQLAIAIAKSKLYESIQRKISNHERLIGELKEANHIKSEFVSHVSHELRTPLTSIKAYLETLTHHIDDPQFTEKKDFLRIVSQETERLIRIVNDILDVSNIEFGQKTLQRSTFSLGEIVEAVVSMLQPKLNDKRIGVEIDLLKTLPKVDADKDLLTQVFINLIGNALKYSPEGTTIRVRAREEAVDIYVSIEDEGIGIPEEQLGKIFDKYYRVKSEESKQYDGVGLGLAIVKNIIEQHGGQITVESEENIGSKFRFSIPKEHCENNLLDYISNGMEAQTELHEMLTVIVRMIAELLSAKIISLMLMDDTRSEMFIKISYGLDEWIVEQARVKVGEGIAGKVAETGMPLLIDNIENNDVFSSPNNPQYETMSLLSVPLIIESVVVGVINVNNKTDGEPFNFDDMTLLMSFSERISKALERARRLDDSSEYMVETVGAFKKMLERQIESKSIEQVVDLAVKLARKLRLSDKEIKVIQYVASVHDIGMTEVSDDILNKTFNLTPEEIKEIQSHPKRGAELIRPLEFVELVSNIILYHHERVDGLGYPMGLRGEAIPIGARILAIIDAYQAMTSDKPYRPRMTPSEAVHELVDCAGKQFDVEAVAQFVEVLKDIGSLTSREAKEYRKMLKGTLESQMYQ